MAAAPASECQAPGFYALAVHGATAPKELVVIKRSKEPKLWLISIRQAFNVVCALGAKVSWGAFYKHVAGKKASKEPILRAAASDEKKFLERTKVMARAASAVLTSAATLYRGLHGMGISSALPLMSSALKDLVAGKAELKPLEVSPAL